MLFRLHYNECDVGWVVWRNTTGTHYILPALTVLKLREKMRWLHQYSLEIEQHHNYQGPVVCICISV